jgi:hypothetical protein
MQNANMQNGWTNIQWVISAWHLLDVMKTPPPLSLLDGVKTLSLIIALIVSSECSNF